MSVVRRVVMFLSGIVVVLGVGLVAAPPGQANPALASAPDPIVLTQHAVPNPQSGVPYDQTPFTATGGTEPYAWSLVSEPPGGLGLAVDVETGALTGSVTQAFCDCRLVIRVTDAEGASDEGMLLLNPYHQTLDMSVAFQVGQPGTAVLREVWCQNCGGVAFAWGEQTPLPPGLSLSSTGVLSGTLTEPGPHQFTVAARSYREDCLSGADCVGDEYERVWNHVDAATVTVVADNRPTLALTAPPYVKGGRAPVVSGELDTYDGLPISGRDIRLEWRPIGVSTWALADVETTDEDGEVVFDTFVPDGPLHVRLVFQGSRPYKPRTTPFAKITMTPTVSLVATPSTSAPRHPVTLAGTVSPNRAGRAVVLQRRDGTEWVNAGVATLDGASAYSFTRRLTATTTYRVRIAAAGGGWNAAASVARTVTVTP